MTVTRLYYPGTIETGQTLLLDNNASHHLIRVMRNRKDAVVTLFNGDGNEYSSILLNENPKHCSVQINKQTTTLRESPLNITLLQGISRGDRMDLCIQKSTELGVNTIIPVSCARSNARLDENRSAKKLEHWRQVMISACEQSGRCVVPELQPIMSYDKAIVLIKTSLKLVLDPASETGLRNFVPVGKELCILAGPEAGLEAGEISLARDKGFQAIGLGPRILRTETAGPACIAAIQTLWGDLA